MGRISTSSRHVIDITGTNSLSLGGWGGDFQCFGEFGASGRARTMKIGRRLSSFHASFFIFGSPKLKTSQRGIVCTRNPHSST